MKLLWQNAFERMANAEPETEFFAYYDVAMKKTALCRMEFFSLASKFSSILRAAGVQRGDVILCTLPLCPEAAVVHYGAVFTGATVIHNEYSPDNSALFLHCANQSTAKHIVMRSESFDGTWSEFKGQTGQPKSGCLHSSFSDSRLPNAKQAFVLNRGGDQDFLSHVRNHGGSYVDHDMSEDSLASLYLTSGTTGLPKLVMRSHKSLVLDAVEGAYPPSVALTGKDRRFYQNAPWSWVVGSSFDLLDGYTRVHPDFWNRPTEPFKMFVDILKTDGVRYMFLTPPEIQGIQQLWDVTTEKFCKSMLVAGFPVTKQICQWMLSVADQMVVRFGCSEVASLSYNIINKVDDFEDFDTGLLYAGASVRSVDKDMKDVPKGTPGRLLLRAPGMFDGYLGQPDKTAEALTPDGWFVTSDAGFINDKNHLFIIGRYDYVINYDGKQYYPSAVEIEIRKHPKVTDVVVVPLPNGSDQHTICAYVVKENGAKISENDVIKAVADAAAKKNNGSVVAPQHVIFTELIDRSNRGKINRNKMIEDAVKIINGS